MTSTLKKYKTMLETFDGLLYDEYKSLDPDGIIDAMDGKYKISKIETELMKAESQREFLLEIMEANGKLIDLLNDNDEGI